ncbi:MAG: tetratricopeptide repeat protein, partial [Candidatus Omnitrophota bacterium]|nr:tetratricopeptide repeat protein [Candidatus Omnitrophota bacterium]
DKYELKSEFGGVSQRIYPQKAADFLVDNKVKGNFFNDFNSGAYLVGRTSPDIKVFIDGRTEVYGPAFFKFYQSIWEKDNDEEFAKAMEKYRITGVFFSSVHSHIPKNDLNYMYRNPDWSVVYFDFDGVIFLKNIPEHQAVIDKHKIDLAQWKAKELNLYRLGAAQVVAYQNTNRAYTLDALGLDGPALAEAQAAVKVNPSHHEPYKMIGAIYGRQKEYQKAFENFRLAALFATHDQKIRENMAQALFDLNEYEHAVSQYQRVIEMWPGDPKNYFLLARAYAHDGKYEDAVKTVRQGFRMNPHAVEDMMMLGNFLIEKNQRKPAQEVFSALSEAKKEDAAVLRRLGDVYEALGDRESARELNERILNLSTQNQAVSNGVQPGN